jgi:hypothetical protein
MVAVGDLGGVCFGLMKENVLQNLTSSSKDSVLIPLKELPFF